MAYLNVFINNSNKNPINVNRDTKPVPPGPGIDKWVKERMVFWHDMSKPVDVYAENFNDWTKYPVNADVAITSTTFTITRFVAENDVVKCYIPSKTKKFPGMKVEVKGIVDGQELYWGYSADVKFVNITSDGTYDIPPLETVKGNLSFRNGNIVGACNITITQLPSGQSVPTNEILKANPYLQDFSGNNRLLKLNNFLFAAMSGVGGYDIASTNILPDRANVTVTDNRIIHITKKLSTTDNMMVNIVPANSNPTHKFKVTGLSDGRQVSLVNRNGGFYTFDNGEHEVTLTYPEGTTSLYNAIGVTGDIGDMDVTIEFLPKYPNALVTDGVDDYGVVENLQQGVKVLFVTINPFIGGKFIYDQRLNNIKPWLFAVFNDKGSIAYNSRNSNGKTYIDGTLNESTIVSALLNKKQIITIVNNDVTGDKTKTPVFFSNTDHNSGWISSAFYNSIGFDSVPTKETDGFTEQELIDYVLENLITQ